MYRGRGAFDEGFFCRKFRRRFISHAVPNLLWEISHPDALSLHLGGRDLPYYSAFQCVSACFYGNFATNVVFL